MVEEKLTVAIRSFIGNKKFEKNNGRPSPPYRSDRKRRKLLYP